MLCQIVTRIQNLANFAGDVAGTMSDTKKITLEPPTIFFTFLGSNRFQTTLKILSFITFI